MSDHEIYELGRIIEDTCRVIDAEIAKGNDDDEHLDGIQDACQYHDKLKRLLKIKADSIPGAIEQFRIAFVAGLDGCEFEDWGMPILRHTLEIAGADLSAVEANKLPGHTS